MVIPGVNSAISIPRVKTGRMLQKRKEDPTKSDSKGDFTYSERKLTPKDMMAFTLFNACLRAHLATFPADGRPCVPSASG
mgnify:FL=1